MVNKFYDKFMLFDQLWIDNCNNSFNPEKFWLTVSHLFLFHKIKNNLNFSMYYIFLFQ